MSKSEFYLSKRKDDKSLVEVCMQNAGNVGTFGHSTMLGKSAREDEVLPLFLQDLYCWPWGEGREERRGCWYCPLVS